MTLFYDFHHTVTDDEIDSQGHVDNLQYLRWTLGAAAGHSAACGWDKKSALASGFGWVVRSHEAKYRAAAMAGDAIIVRTWISDVGRYASMRKYVVCRMNEPEVLTRVQTRWVYVDLRVHQVVAVPQTIVDGMSVCKTQPPLPWEDAG